MSKKRLVDIDPSEHSSGPYYECAPCAIYLSRACERESHDVSEGGYLLSEKATMEATQLLLEHYFRDSRFEIIREAPRGKGSSPSGKPKRCDWVVSEIVGGEENDLLLLECKKESHKFYLKDGWKIWPQLHEYCQNACGQAVHGAGVWAAMLQGATLTTLVFEPTRGLAGERRYDMISGDREVQDKAHTFFKTAVLGPPFG